MSAPKVGEKFRSFFESERARILSSCTSCGKCYEVCPMPAYIEKKDGSTSGQVAAGVLGLLRDGTAQGTALEWVKVCMRTGCCVPACPENVNPKMMLRLAKIIALGGYGAAPLIPKKEDRDYFQRIRAFAELELSEDEIREWMT